MLIQFIIILFSFFAIFRLIDKFKRKEVFIKEFLLWMIVWCSVIGATVWFKKVDIIAGFFGVERGADMAIYISILVLFYLVFKIIVKLDKIDKSMTKIVRGIAINSAIDKEEK